MLCRKHPSVMGSQMFGELSRHRHCSSESHLPVRPFFRLGVYIGREQLPLPVSRSQHRRLDSEAAAVQQLLT